MTAPILVALDVPTAEEAVRLAERVAPHVAGFKVGLELLTGPGPGIVGAIGDLGKPVFCDAKLHDIPATVERAAFQLGRMGARWLTVHASGGRSMLSAARDGLEDGSDGNAGVLAVTVLTSLDAADLAAIGVNGSPGRQVARLARIAAESGVEGVVCSVRELGDVGQVAPGLIRVTPGIRPAGTGADDQVRIATPEEAIDRGADLLVIGRPITKAPDPAEAAQTIAASIVDRDRPAR